MEVLYPICCGLDVHKQMVVACLISSLPDGQRQKELKLFATTTIELEHLADWLEASGCTHVAMESTGVYWKPIYNILAGKFELLVVNAGHIKTCPTDY